MSNDTHRDYGCWYGMPEKPTANVNPISVASGGIASAWANATKEELERLHLPVPALSWQTSAVQEPSRRKSVTVPQDIAARHLKEAVRETLGTDRLPPDVTVEGGLYGTGGTITINSPELPENPDGKWTVDITPKPKKAKA